MKRPKQAPPTTEETVMRTRQVEELVRLDEEENTRVKRLVRGRVGAGSMLSARRGAAATAGGGSGGVGGGGGGGGSTGGASSGRGMVRPATRTAVAYR